MLSLASDILRCRGHWESTGGTEAQGRMWWLTRRRSRQKRIMKLSRITLRPINSLRGGVISVDAIPKRPVGRLRKDLRAMVNKSSPNLQAKL